MNKKLKDYRWTKEMEMKGNKRKITVGDQDQNLTKTGSMKMVLTDTATTNLALIATDLIAKVLINMANQERR